MTAERRLRQRRGSLQRRADDLAWAAGVIDSESVVRLEVTGTPVVKVDVCWLPMVERLAAVLGGRVRPNRGGRGCIKPVHRWLLCGDAGRAAMRRLLPLLTEKADQVELVLTVEKCHPGGMLTNAQRAYRTHVRAELSRMKRIEWR